MKITASSLSRAKRCLWWARSDVSYAEVPDSGAGNEGTEFHDRIAWLINTCTTERSRFPLKIVDLPPSPGPRMSALVKSACDFLGATVEGIAEEAYKYDVVSGKATVLGVNINREYGELSDSEIACTSDHVFVERGAVLVVRDWKTGSPEFVELVEENAQLQCLGLCAALVRGWDGPVRLEVVYVREKQCYPESVMTSAAELKKFAAELQLLYIQIADSEAVAGDHCRCCPARGSCPATKAAMAEFHVALNLPTGVAASDVRKLLPVWTTEMISLENDALMAEQLPALEKAVDAVKDALKLRAKARGGIPLSDGKIWKEVTFKKSVMDNEKVEALLGPRFGECRKEILQTQMRRMKA